MKTRIINKVLHNPLLPFSYLLSTMSPMIKSSETYLRVYYRIMTGKKLNLEHPVSFQEKTQWLKLHNTDPLFTQLVDKYAVRQFVADRIGEEHLIPLLGVYNRFEDIDFDALPTRFVLKSTHDSGSVVVCKDKSKLNKQEARKKLNKSLKRNYFWEGREYPYKNVPPKIVVEQYMEDAETGELTDYKFFCFNGKPEYIFVASERFSGDGVPKFTYFDMDFNVLPIRSKGHNNSDILKKPSCFDEMIKVLNQLCIDTPFVRIDLYSINNKVYFGEYTFFHDGGVVPMEPDEWNNRMGEMIKLPEEK